MLVDTLLPWPKGKGPDPAHLAEDSRNAILELYGLDALEDDPELVQITSFVAKMCDAPVCLVSLVEKERQRFLAREGLTETETPRPTSFCAHAMLEPVPMVIRDATQDARFDTNPLVTGHPHIRFYAGAPLISHEGAPLGSLCVIDTKPRLEGLTPLQLEGLQVMAASVMRRLRHRREALATAAELEKSEQQLQMLADSIPDIAWSAEQSGEFSYFNARWDEVTGAEPPRNVAGWSTVIHPDDFTATAARFEEAVTKAETFEDEWRLRQSDGTYRWILSRATPSTDDPATARWFGTITDVHEARQQSDQRDLLARELSHRIKNIFAVISGLIAIRSRNEPDLKNFADELTGAIKSLGKAHDYVNPVAGRKGDSLGDLLQDLLAPYQNGVKSNITVQGEDNLSIGATAATPLALIFHELATNSAKYGSFSQPGGTVEIKIGRGDKADLEHLTDTDEAPIEITWSELGVAPFRTEDNPREGFGSRLLRMSVEGQLRGKMTRIFDTDGMEVKLTIPAQAISGI